MTHEEFLAIVKNQSAWRDAFYIQQDIRRKRKLLIMSRHKSRGNKSEEYIRERLNAFRNN